MKWATYCYIAFSSEIFLSNHMDKILTNTIFRGHQNCLKYAANLNMASQSVHNWGTRKSWRVCGGLTTLAGLQHL